MLFLVLLALVLLLAVNSLTVDNMAGLVKRSLGKISPATSCFMLCDVQDRFRPLLYEGESVVSTSNFLCRTAEELSVPLVCTEQYVKAFGRTCADVLKVPSTEDCPERQIACPTFEKKLFSMCTPEVLSHIESLGERTSFVLFGIEAHVCVQQTALDLMERGHDVHVVVDAVTSMSALDRDLALKRMERSGAFLTTSQSVAFMLMQTAEHPNFKTMSKMVAAHAKVPNAFHKNAS